MKKAERIERYGKEAWAKQLQQVRDWRKAHPEQVKATGKRYRDTHLEQKRATEKDWRATHTEQLKAKSKAWYNEHREKAKADLKVWLKTDKGEASQKKSVAKFRKTDSGIASSKKRNAKRRMLEFIPLNERFEGSEAHHIDKEFIIYVPKEMHRSVWHNIHTGKGMEQINDMAIDFCYGD